MNVLVLMAGKGDRFLHQASRDARFSLPKPMIPVRGRSILEWTTRSLPFVPHGNGAVHSDPLLRVNLTFAVRADHVRDFAIDHFLTELYGPEINIVPFEQITRGNLETALIASNRITPEDPLLVLDSDNAYVDNGILGTLQRSKTFGPSAVVCYFYEESPQPKWAFVRVDDSGQVWEIGEKDPGIIKRGGRPLVGTFFFSSTLFFRTVAEDIIGAGRMTGTPGKEEFYMSQSIRQMLARGERVFGHEVNEVLPLGTPEDVDVFERNESWKPPQNFEFA